MRKKAKETNEERNSTIQRKSHTVVSPSESQQAINFDQMDMAAMSNY